MLCTHYDCRCARASELACMSDQAGSPELADRLMSDAAMCHRQEVRCRAQLSLPGIGHWEDNDD